MPGIAESKESPDQHKSEEAISVPTEPVPKPLQHSIPLNSGKLASHSESFSFKDVDWGLFNKMTAKILQDRKDQDEKESQPKTPRISAEKEKIIGKLEQEVEKLEKQRSFKY